MANVVPDLVTLPSHMPSLLFSWYQIILVDEVLLKRLVLSTHTYMTQAHMCEQLAQHRYIKFNSGESNLRLPDHNHCSAQLTFNKQQEMNNEYTHLAVITECS